MQKEQTGGVFSYSTRKALREEVFGFYEGKGWLLY